MIRFACPGCAATFSVADEKAGKNGKCPKCNSQFTIPAAEPDIDPAPPAADLDPTPPPLPPPPTPIPATSEQPVEIDACPTCNTRLSVLPTEVGLDIQCPNCQGVFRAIRADAPPPPDAGSKRSSGGVLVKLGSGGRQEEDDERPSKRRSRRDDDDDDRPSRRSRRSRRDDDDMEDDQDRDYRPSRRSRRGGYGGGCPYCGTSEAPYYRSQISTGGWVTFALLLAFCWPLFWIGLLIREDVRVCGDCGGKVG